MKEINSIERCKNTVSNKMKCLVWITIVAAVLVCVIGFYKPLIQKNLLNNYVEILVFLSIGFLLCKGVYFQRKIYVFCFLFLVWIMITHWMKGETILAVNDRAIFVIRCLVCGVALPFAHAMEDTKKRKYIDFILIIIVAISALLCWLCLWGLIRGENIILFDGKVTFGVIYNITERMMLKVLNLHYYIAGYIAVVCFFISLYLMVSHLSKKSIVMGSVLLVTFASIVILCYSRTAVFAWVLGIIIVIYLLLQKMNLTKGTRRLFLGFTIVGGIVGTILGMNYVYSAVNSIRDIWYGISTLSSRTTIWKALIEVFRDRPEAILFGLPQEQIMDIVNSYLPDLDIIGHMHSGYITTLASIGIPGFVAVVFFCVYLGISSCKILFTESAGSFTVTDKLMVIVPLVCLTMNLVESIVFYNVTHMEIMNIILALFSGYIIEKAQCKENVRDNKVYE